MAKLIDYADAAPEAKAVFEDIAAARGLAPQDVNNAWKAMARHPANMEAFWALAKQTMKPGALDALTKEMVYLAVSMANRCEYCTASHTAQAKKKGMSEAMLGELIAVVGLAAMGNALAGAYRQPVDAQFEDA